MSDLPSVTPQFAPQPTEVAWPTAQWPRGTSDHQEELESVASFVAVYFEAHAARMRPANRELAAFVAVHMVDQLTHALVAQRTNVSRAAAIDEITDVALRYLLRDGPA